MSTCLGPYLLGPSTGHRQVKEVVRFIVWNDSLLHAEDEESSGLPSGGSSELICFSRDAPRTYPQGSSAASFAPFSCAFQIEMGKALGYVFLVRRADAETPRDLVYSDVAWPSMHVLRITIEGVAS
ncbi:hypothetical protein NL676_003344 [Syzygium grande]|nr:hypothetical protein NL676_003344 [Syzygium grande]